MATTPKIPPDLIEGTIDILVDLYLSHRWAASSETPPAREHSAEKREREDAREPASGEAREG